MTDDDLKSLALDFHDQMVGIDLLRAVFQAGAASRDAEIAELVAALEHILAGALSLPRFAEAEAIAVIAKVRKP